jgi:3-oxoacyl-[acyl-carrier-protein] synthase-1
MEKKIFVRTVYINSDNIFSPLGKNTAANMRAIRQGLSGIREHHLPMNPDPFYAALFSPGDIPKDQELTPFEQIVFLSAKDAVQNARLDPPQSKSKTGFILSSTKGNIQLIENLPEGMIPEEKISLNNSASIIAKKLGVESEPLVVSHACISGLLAMITGMRLIQSGVYDQVIVSGADLITSFIFSGFRSFQAISPKPCRPFDASRDGISLGEAAATVILSANKNPGDIILAGGSVSNDANHISGPSRTGEELWLAIDRAMTQAGVGAEEIDFISAHGTATRYNDDMEAKAIHLAGLERVPVNSFKAYYGHTLGAAGILESILTIHSMKENILVPTLGYSEPGTEKSINIIKELIPATLKKSLKTASGFGGCNAAIVVIDN